MYTTPVPKALNSWPERWIGMAAAVLCLIVSIWAWLALRTLQPLWPLPDLYLLEMIVVSSLGAWGLWRPRARFATSSMNLTWVCSGLIFGFAILAGFSIGLYYLPSGGLLAIAALLSDLRQTGRLLIHLGIGLAAAVLQAALMLAIIQI